MLNKEMVPNPKPQVVNGGENGSLVYACKKYGKSHLGKCSMDTDNYFLYGKSGHSLRDFLSIFDKGKYGRQDPLSGCFSSTPKKNWFYALQT